MGLIFFHFLKKWRNVVTEIQFSSPLVQNHVAIFEHSQSYSPCDNLKVWLTSPFDFFKFGCFQQYLLTSKQSTNRAPVTGVSARDDTASKKDRGGLGSQWHPVIDPALFHGAVLLPSGGSFTGRYKRTGWDLRPWSTFEGQRRCLRVWVRATLALVKGSHRGVVTWSREAVVKWPLRKQWSCFSSRPNCTFPNQEWPLNCIRHQQF